MANLLGQNIGTNYKGILNLNTLNGNLTTTLQAVTDGDGNASPLQLSTTKVLLGTTAGGLPQTINIGETDKLGSALYFATYVIYGDFMELRGNSGIQIPTNNLVVGTTSASARLHVRGDGINPIARFESNAAVQILGVNNNFITIGREGNIGPNIYAFNSTPLTPDALGFGLAFASFKTNFDSNNYDVYFSGVDYTNTTGTANHISIKRTFAAEAGAGNYRPFNIEYTLNNSGAQTGTATGIFLNATETALNGMGHNLIDLQMNSVSRFSVSRLGALTTEGITSNSNIIAAGTASYQWLSRSRMNSPSDGVITILNNGSTDFGRLQFGGTTNAFPAIKRSGAGIQIRLADDSDFALFDSAAININHTSDGVLSFTKAGTNSFSFQKDAARIYFYNNTLAQPAYSITNNNAIVFGNSFDAVLSAQLEIVSTTKGFLPPRMTTTQKNAIATPASGLVVYDSTLNKLAVYTGSAWETVTSI